MVSYTGLCDCTNSIKEQMRYLTVAVTFCLGFIRIVIGGPEATLAVVGNVVTVEDSFIQLECLINDYDDDHFSSMYKLTSLTERPGSSVVRCLPGLCLPQSASRSRYSYYRNNAGMYVNITSLNREEDQGWWRCSLDYATPNVEDVIYLAVYRSPVGISILDPAESIDLAVAGASITCGTLNCTNPAPVISWYFTDGIDRFMYFNDNESIISNSSACTSPERTYRQTMILLRYTESPNRNHMTLSLQCGLSHLTLPVEVYTKEQVQVTFAGKPGSLIISKGGIYEVNSTVVLTCSVSANPEPSILWHREGDNRPLQTGLGTKSQLVIDHIQCHQMGTYICFAENDIGKTEGNVEVLVKCPPMEIVPREKNVYSVIGSRLVLVVRTISLRPPTFIWHDPNGDKLPGDGEHVQIDTGSTSTLTIDQLEMYGTYTVTVSNGIEPDPIFEFHVKTRETTNVDSQVEVQREQSVGLIVGLTTLGAFVIGIIAVLLIGLLVKHIRQYRKNGTDGPDYATVTEHKSQGSTYDSRKNGTDGNGYLKPTVQDPDLVTHM